MRKGYLFFLTLVSVLSLVGTASVSAQPAAPSAVCMADLDGNGLSDMAATYQSTGMLRVFLNLGDGRFTSSDYPVGNQPRHCATADVNLDGRLAIVVANSGSNNVSVLLNTGAGAFDRLMKLSRRIRSVERGHQRRQRRRL